MSIELCRLAERAGVELARLALVRFQDGCRFQSANLSMVDVSLGRPCPESVSASGSFVLPSTHPWYPRRESNPHLNLRRVISYPLNYEDLLLVSLRIWSRLRESNPFL